MTILKQKISGEILIASGVLLLAGFLFFLPQGIYAAAVFTAGYYKDHGGIEDYSCPNGFWRAYIEVKDYSEELIVPDEITIRAIWYEEGTEVGIPIYSNIWNGPATSTFETDCIEIRANNGTMVLDVRTTKQGFYAMKAANNPRSSGSALNRSRWSKTLYLASFDAEANIAYTFPENYQWISGREEHSEMKLFVDSTPLDKNITEISAEIIHTSTGDRFFINETNLNINKEEAVLPLPSLSGHGQYSWQVTLTRSTSYILYNENAISYFNFDPNPPILDWRSGTRSVSGKLQAPSIAARFKDEPTPSSGMHKIELYLNNDVGGDNPDNKMILRQTCTRISPITSYSCGYTGELKEYLESKRYTYYAIGYDFVGNETKIAEASFTINPINPSRLTIYSSVNGSLVTGAPFEVVSVTNVTGEGEYPEVGSYQTTKTFDGTVDRYTVTLEAPESHNGRPFSYWDTCTNSRRTTRTAIYGFNHSNRMHFGVSRLQIYSRSLTNAGSMSSDLATEIRAIKTRIEQTGGSPSNFLSPSGYIDRTGNQTFYKTVTGEINDLGLKFNDSEDGILKFFGFLGTFCQTIDGPECRGSAIYQCRTLTNRYSINRTVRVESYLGVSPTGGVKIEGSRNMQSGTTTAEGYYAFSSMAHPNNFTGTLRAPETILNDEGEIVEFGYWEGCDPRPPGNDKFDCYIGTEVAWFYKVSVTVKAHYKSSVDEPSVDCGALPNNTCVPDEPPWYCEEGTLRRYCVECGCPPGYTCIDEPSLYGKYGRCYRHYTLSVESDPVEGILIDSASGHGDTTNYQIFDILVPPHGPDIISLTASATHGIYDFKEWTGDCSTTTDYTCELTMDSDKTVTAEYSAGPTAVMECSIGPTACKGPGCVCSNVSPLPVWQTFRGVVYEVKNMSTSTNPDRYIASSTWQIRNSNTNILVFEDSCPSSPLCDITIQPTITTGNYNIMLEVADDQNSTSSTSHQIRIKRDISTDFECSLEEGGTPQPCSDISPLVGQTVYFTGSAVPSEADVPTSIISWNWKKGKEGESESDFSQFSYSSSTASTTFTTATNTVLLIVRDDHPEDGSYPAGRQASEIKTLKVSLPLPEYRPISPAARQDSFLAKIINIFR